MTSDHPSRETVVPRGKSHPRSEILYLNCGDLKQGFARVRCADCHPHLHVMATDGGFTPDGIFHPIPTMSLKPMEELFGHQVIKMLSGKILLSPERIRLLESWENSGFTIDALVRVGADDTLGRENLARSLLH